MKKKSKTFISKLLLMVMLVSLAVPVKVSAAGPMRFQDVIPGKWYYNSVEYVYSKNLMTGITDTSFEPNTSLTRGMFVTILGRMAGINPNDSSYQRSNFDDVAVGKWYTPYVAWAVKNGIVNGLTPDIFGVNVNITREQMATMITRYLNSIQIQLPYASDKAAVFHDAGAISSWAKQGVEMMRRTGLLMGDSRSHFNPLNSATRAEAATVFMRLQKAIQQGGTTEPAFVHGDTIQEYKGNLYTVYSMFDSANMIQIPNGDYCMRLAVYENKIYYTESNGTGGGPTALYRTNLDFTGKTKLLNNVDSISEFCIFDDILYYTAFIDDGIYQSRSLNLNTMTVKNEPFFYVFGTDEVWIIKDQIWDGNYYCCSPGFLYGQPLPEGAYWTESLVGGLHKDKMYFFNKYSVMQSSVYQTDKETLAAGPYIEYDQYLILGDGLYYYEYDDDYTNENDDYMLHRLDLVTGKETKYDVREYEYHYADWGIMPCFWPINEINGKLYFSNYVEHSSGMNTMCYEMDLNTGSIRAIGLWFES